MVNSFLGRPFSSVRRDGSVKSPISRLESSIRNVVPSSVRKKWSKFWKESIDRDENEPKTTPEPVEIKVESGSTNNSGNPSSFGSATFHSQLMSLEQRSLDRYPPTRVVSVAQVQSGLLEMLSSRPEAHTDLFLKLQQQGRLETDEEEQMLSECTPFERNVFMLEAALVDQADLVKRLLDHDAELTFMDRQRLSVVHIAALVGSLNCLQLVKTVSRTWPAQWGTEWSPLHCAVLQDSQAALAFLRSEGFTESEGGVGLLHTAVQANALSCLQFLLDSGCSVNEVDCSGETPLNLAADAGHQQALQMLLDAGAQIELRTCADQATALHLAAEGDHPECVRRLLAAGAHPEVRNFRGQTPLHLASRVEAEGCVEALLDAGANPNVVNEDGRSPLHTALACDECHSLDVIRVLLARGANVNLQDQYGYTALHLAALNEMLEAVDLLLHSGADLSVKNKWGISGLSAIMHKAPRCLDTVRERLNESISIYDPENRNKEVEMKLDFRFLVRNGPRGEIRVVKAFVDDGQKEMLDHPLCQAFLFLKWKKLRKLFYARLAYNISFVLLLTGFVTMMHADCSTTEMMVDDSTSKTVCEDVQEATARHRTYLYILSGFCVISILKEMYLLLVAPNRRNYVSKFEHGLLWCTIISVFLMFPFFTGKFKLWQRYVGAISVLLSWAYLMLLFGQLPMFGIYVQMFSKVLNNFFRIITVYSMLLIGFTFSFSIIYPEPIHSTTITDSFLEAVLRMVGGIDLIGLANRNNGNIFYRIIASVMILVLIVILTIALMNLMIGIAVSDIEGLQATAGLQRLVQVTDLVDYIESMVLSPYLKYLPPFLKEMMERNILLSPSNYRWVFIVHPLDSRDKRLPDNIVAKAFQLALNEKQSSHNQEKNSRFLRKTSIFGSTDKCDEKYVSMRKFSYELNPFVIEEAVSEAIEKKLIEMENKLHYKTHLDTLQSQSKLILSTLMDNQNTLQSLLEQLNVSRSDLHC